MALTSIETLQRYLSHEGQRYLSLPGSSYGLSDASSDTASLDADASSTDHGEHCKSVSLLDTATRQVHVFSLERNGEEEEVTVKEFIALMERELSDLVELTRPGTCIRVLCAAVGESCINICDNVHTVSYHLLDGQPWYIKTGIFPSNHINVHIRQINGDRFSHVNEAAIKIDPEKSLVKELKQKFARMTCTFPHNLHMVLNRKELENDMRLSDYNLTDGSVVPCVSGDQRRWFCSTYIHVPQHCLLENGHKWQQDSMPEERRDISRHSPVWRRAAPGLWLEGVCHNEICVAHSKVVVMNQGFGDLDFVNERHRCKCPMCYEQVTPFMYGMNKCEWTTVGLAKESGDLPHVLRQPWQRQEEGHSSFILKRDDWSLFRISCKQLNHSSSFCVVCMSAVVSDVAKTPCGHTYHTACLAANADCLRCLGEGSMTNYQRLFL